MRILPQISVSEIAVQRQPKARVDVVLVRLAFQRSRSSGNSHLQREARRVRLAFQRSRSSGNSTDIVDLNYRRLAFQRSRSSGNWLSAAPVICRRLAFQRSRSSGNSASPFCLADSKISVSEIAVQRQLANTPRSFVV